MWLLENDGDVFGGKKLWLRPGKRYLFGRTNYGDGSFAIPDKTISRKHMVIELAAIPEGKGADLRSRSAITVEDLKTKLGTWVNGENIQGQKQELTADENELKLANYGHLFRITWRSVVLSFSFTRAELQQPGVWAFFQKNLEPLDIKYTTEYDSQDTTYVVNKKLSNTSKVLQALIDGKPFVNEGFIQALIAAAKPHPDENGVETSELEDNFEAAWPQANDYLPPRAEGPGADRPMTAFAPDRRRQEIFDGYTFIFYEKKRFEDLHPVITSGKGKALLKEATPNVTEIDDFIRFVKNIAGEKGLGEFEDGSEGRGVVVVRYVPATGESTDEWYLNFYNQVALRLDHRPIETRDFLPAILDIEPAQLRRALEIEPTPRDPATQVLSQANGDHAGDTGAMEIDEVQETIKEPPPPSTRRGGRPRRAPKSRFKGFDHGSDNDDDDKDEVQPTSAQQPSDTASQSQPLEALGRSQRKRPAPERDIMDEVAPTAAAIKRIRLETGEDPLPAWPSPPSPVESLPRSPPPQTKTKATRGRTAASTAATDGKSKKRAPVSDGDYLNQYITEGQEEEANLRAEREQIQRELAEGTIDFEEIRQGTVVETVEVRILPQAAPGSGRQQGNQDDRWDSRWNGLRNFKKFGRQGRQQPRNIIPLEPVMTKEYSMRGDYWLEKRRKKVGNVEGDDEEGTQSQRNRSQQQQQASKNKDSVPIMPTARDMDITEIRSDSSDSHEEDGNEPGGRSAHGSESPLLLVPAAPSRSRKGKAAQKAGQSQKRAAAEPLSTEKPAKRPRATNSTGRVTRATRTTRARTVEKSDEDEDSCDGGDDSDEGNGLNFTFGKRK